MDIALSFVPALVQVARIEKIKQAVEKTYGRKGRRIVEMNNRAIDNTLAALLEVQVPQEATGKNERHQLIPDDAPAFVRDVTAKLIAGKGDETYQEIQGVRHHFDDRETATQLLLGAGE